MQRAIHYSVENGDIWNLCHEGEFDSNARKIYMHDRISAFWSVQCTHSASLSNCFLYVRSDPCTSTRALVFSKTPAKLFAWYNQWSKSCLLALKAKMSNALHMCLCYRRVNEATVKHDAIACTRYCVHSRWKYFPMLVLVQSNNILGVLFAAFIVVGVGVVYFWYSKNVVFLFSRKHFIFG